MRHNRFLCWRKAEHMTRERDDAGRLILTCACGYSVPAISRSAAEWHTVKSGEQSAVLQAQVKPKKVRKRHNVTDIGQRRQG